MRPLLRTIEGNDTPDRADDASNISSLRLPPEMEGRPDAAELRAFIRSFRKINNAGDRRAILEAVVQAADGDGS